MSLTGSWGPGSFTKNGFEPRRPWLLTHLDEVMALYATSEPLRGRVPPQPALAAAGRTTCVPALLRQAHPVPPVLRRLLPGNRYPYAAGAGILLALSFPNASVAGFAWIAPGLFVALTLGTRGWETYRIGYVAGLACYLGSLYWLLNIPFRWHGIPVGPAVGWLSLSAFLALFIGVWVWLLNRLASAAGALGPSSENSVLPSSWSARAAWCLLGAAAWVALEMLLARIFGGFPWNILAASQYRLTPLLQIAAITGVYGVSFLVVWFSLALLSAGVRFYRQPLNRSVFVLELAAPGLVIALLFAWGADQIRSAPVPSKSIRVTLVQPSIPQTLIWDPGKDDERLRELISLSEQALTNETDLVVWPEAAVPKLLRFDQQVFDAVTGLAERHKVWMIIGADDAEPRTPDGQEADYFNSSFLIDPSGNLRDTYKKSALVIFGEYVPLSSWLPFLKYFTPVQGGFTPGKSTVPFVMMDLGVVTSVLICYEDIFPEMGREAARPGTAFLVNITNDGWFGEGSAQWQQAVTALFRAIENRVPLVRCTNNGLTCWIDSYGVIRQIFRDERESIYGRGFLRFNLPFLETPDLNQTFYNRHGDWFGWSCVGLTLLTAAGMGLAHRRQSYRESKAA